MRFIAILSGTVLAASFLSTPARAQTPVGEVNRGERNWYAGIGAMPWVFYGALTVKAGRVVGDHLLVGVESGGMYGLGNSLLSHAYGDAVVTWFPFAPSGAYLKGGVGYGASKDEETDGTTRTRSGLEVRYGGGWERSVNWRNFTGKPASWGLELTMSTPSGAAGGLFMLVTFNVY